MNKRMTDNWDTISLMTGVPGPGQEKVINNIDMGLSLEKYWMLSARIDSTGFSPRLTIRYKKIAALMHFFQLGVGKTLTMKGRDLDTAKAGLLASMPRGRIGALHVIEEIDRLFGAYEKSLYLFPASVHKTHIPLSRSKVAPTIVELTTGLMDDIEIGEYTA